MQNKAIEAKKGESQILVFNLLKEEFGLNISCVREVLRSKEIHPIPQSPDFVEGVINLRGHIIAVIDLRKKFKIKAAKNDPKTRIIVCRIDPVKALKPIEKGVDYSAGERKSFIVGLIVDSVSAVLNLAKESIQSTPEIVSTQIEHSYISSIAQIDESIITILNVENILTKSEIGKLSMIQKHRKKK